jgi:UDP-N-acetylglucosamine 2-epimerase (non-hydrolysing)
MKILHVAGARPNFMKIAPVLAEIRRRGGPLEHLLVHTGQHYDDRMSRIFFEELELPEADVNLAVGSGSHAWQTAHVMLRFEPVLAEYKPDWVLVPGDVNSTLACALVAVKLGFRVAHLEAGLRSFDRTMPEEINRLVTDQIADLLLTPSPDANRNLLREGVAPEKIALVGNVMIDTLVRLRPKAELRWPALSRQWSLREKDFALVTLHRPSNVDDPLRLAGVLRALAELSREIPVLFPVHPRTRQRLAGQDDTGGQLRMVEPLGYLDFLALQPRAALVITDSGGIQEETTYLGVPCLTMRANTERPITIEEGTNRLAPGGVDQLPAAAREILAAPPPARRPALWDGHAAARVVDALLAAAPA